MNPFVMVASAWARKPGSFSEPAWRCGSAARYGFRVNVEDYPTRYDSYATAGRLIARTGHQVSSAVRCSSERPYFLCDAA